MNKRNYPLFLIDRAKNQKYPNTYITCTDKNVGFVAQVSLIENDVPYYSLVENQKDFDLFKKTTKGGLYFEIIDFLNPDLDYNSSTNKSKIESLCKRAFKKCIHNEVDKVPNGEFGIDQQIKMIEETIELNERNYDSLVERARGNTKHADYLIKLSKAVLNTLLRVKNYE